MTELAKIATAWMDGLWDDDASLLRYPTDSRHSVRESAWYALGLILRDEAGDVDRARRALRAVCSNQINAPGMPFHGTFKRTPEDPTLTREAVVWQDYDPNWRQFIGCTFALLIDDFKDALGDQLCRRMVHATFLAADSEPADRIPPSYSNIALMRAWLDAWSGTEQRGEAFAQAIIGEFEASGGFAEFNSPTYYGVDLFALALWRLRPPTELFSSIGRVLEQRLWLDIGDFYHSGLRNLCGPWVRSYGMNTQHYIALFGMYLPEALPDLSGPFDHAHDLCFAPLAALVPSEEPRDALVGSAPRRIVRGVAGMQVSAVINEESMWGGLALASARSPQLHPATAHWRSPDGDVAWLRVRSRGGLEAVALEEGLVLDIGERGATAEVSCDTTSLSFSRPPREIEGRKLRFDPGVLEIAIAV